MAENAIGHFGPELEERLSQAGDPDGEVGPDGARSGWNCEKSRWWYFPS
jgi:hypothetical protein